MSLIYVKPKDLRRVRNPEAIPPSPLPLEGAVVSSSVYWTRRILDGDVEIIADYFTNQDQAESTKAAKKTEKGKQE
jgi:hypothetical protein